MIDSAPAGRVIGMGDIIVTQVGEVSRAMVALPASLPKVTGVFGETLGAILSSVTGAGATALEPVEPNPTTPPASPER